MLLSPASIPLHPRADSSSVPPAGWKGQMWGGYKSLPSRTLPWHGCDVHGGVCSSSLLGPPKSIFTPPLPIACSFLPGPHRQWQSCPAPSPGTQKAGVCWAVPARGSSPWPCRVSPGLSSGRSGTSPWPWDTCDHRDTQLRAWQAQRCPETLRCQVSTKPMVFH